ncbi:metallophosphoesterase family protein [bacterium]
MQIFISIFLLLSLSGNLYSAGNINDSSQLSASNQKFNFAILGDRTGAGPDSWKILDRAIAEVNRLQPDFVVMIGDVIEGSRQTMQLNLEWTEAMSHLDSLKVPLFLVPGNHDIFNGTSYQLWKEKIGNPYHAFSYRGCRFIFLNTEESQGAGESGLGVQQLNFLRNEIQNHQYDHLFLFMHQPMWILKKGLGQQWNEIETLLADRPYTVIAGHLHVLAAKRTKGNMLLIQGPTGGSMRMQRNPVLGFFHHITWVSVDQGHPSFAFIEPGRIYGESTALQAYQRYVQGMMLIDGNL